MHRPYLGVSLVNFFSRLLVKVAVWTQINFFPLLQKYLINETVEFFHFYENGVQCQFYKNGHQKSVFVSTNSHNFKVSKEIHPLSVEIKLNKSVAADLHAPTVHSICV